MNDPILDKIDEMVKIIETSQEYQTYLFLHEKLRKHKKANELIQKVKVLQKQIVQKEALKEDTNLLEKDFKEVLNTLERIPLYVEFIDIQEQLNNVYQTVKERLDYYFDDLFNKE